jgi:pimeloyl-ACP methyl ester carboxylesterase
VHCPTLVIQGRQDEYGTDRQVNAVVAALGGRCEGVMLDRCGHAPHFDQRATVADIMARFVRSLE